MVSTNGEVKKKKQSGKTIVEERELCPTLQTTNGRQSVEHRRGRGTTRRFRRPEKATMSKRQGFCKAS